MIIISKAVHKGATAIILCMALTGVTARAAGEDDFDRMNFFTEEIRKCVEAEKAKGSNPDEAVKGLTECRNRIDGYSRERERSREEMIAMITEQIRIAEKGIIEFQKMADVSKALLALIEKPEDKQQ